MARHWLPWCLGALALLPVQPARAEWSGYLKSLWFRTDTVVGNPEPAYLGVNRLRLTWRDQLADVHLVTSYDLEARLGSYLDTDQYRLQEELAPTPYLNVQHRRRKGAQTEIDHGFYRLYGQAALGPVDVRVGRQQLNWSRTFLWSSFDRFNPYDPLQLEPEERAGVDALQLVWNLAADRNLEWVGVPAHDKSQQQQGLRYRGRWGQSDVDLMLADFGPVHSAGLAGAGQWAGAGWRFEATHNRMTGPGPGASPASYQDLVLSADYAFTDNTSMVAEWLYRGDGASRAEDYDVISYLAGRRTDLARRYAGVIARYGAAPLARLELTMLANLDDGSRAWIPSFNFSPGRFEDLNLRLGVQAFEGATNSEFGRQNTLAFAEVQWFY